MKSNENDLQMNYLESWTPWHQRYRAQRFQNQYCLVRGKQTDDGHLFHYEYLKRERPKDKQLIQFFFGWKNDKKFDERKKKINSGIDTSKQAVENEEIYGKNNNNTNLNEWEIDLQHKMIN